MADIAKCHGNKVVDEHTIYCAVMLMCKRYTAPHGPVVQSYIEPAGDFTKQKGCSLYIPNQNKETK